MAPSFLRKISKKAPDAFEETVAKALVDLESNGELKADLKDLYIASAKEIDIGGGRKAIVIHVPFRLLKSFHKIQQRLVRELEKKFSGKDVVLVGARRMLNKTRSLKNPRPRSRTLTNVHKERPPATIGPRHRSFRARPRVSLTPPPRPSPRSPGVRAGPEHDRVQVGHLLRRVQEAHRDRGGLRVPRGRVEPPLRLRDGLRMYCVRRGRGADRAGGRARATGLEERAVSREGGCL